MGKDHYLNIVIESNPLRDQSFGKSIILRRMEDLESRDIAYLIEVDGEEWVAIADLKKALVIYNQLRVSTNIGQIYRAYDDMIKEIDSKIVREKDD